MGCHFDIPNTFIIPCIDDSDFSVVLTSVLASISDIDEFAARFVDYAVGTRFKLDGVEKLKGVALKDPQHCIVSAGYEQLIELWNEQGSLRLLKSGNAAHPLASLQIHDLQCAVL